MDSKMFCSYGILPLLLDDMGMLPYWYVTDFLRMNVLNQVQY